VLSPRVLLTAAHCLRPLRGHGGPLSGRRWERQVIIPVDAAIAHPLYRADAIKARVEIDRPRLIRTARPLGPRFAAAAIADGGPPPIGASAIVSGYGAASEGDWSSGGELRSVRLASASRRRPFSSGPPIRPEGRPAPAMAIPARPSGRADGWTAIAIVAWAQAAWAGCGGLTQGPLLAPLKGWIEETERRLAAGG